MPRLALVLVTLAFAACGSDTSTDDPATSAESYTVRGLYEGTRFEGAAVALVHEAIPGVMDAMRMNLVLDDPAEVEGLTVGATVRFTVTVGDRLVASNFEALPDTTTLDLPAELQPGAVDADTTGS